MVRYRVNDPLVAVCRKRSGTSFITVGCTFSFINVSAGSTLVIHGSVQESGFWPDMTDSLWGEDVHSFYGQSPYWSERKGASREDIGLEESRTGTTGRSHGAL
jgi:hypothetical protein